MMTPFCFHCKHFKGLDDTYAYQAFPQGIPDEIIYREAQHRNRLLMKALMKSPVQKKGMK
jgi:hypothetical protein